MRSWNGVGRGVLAMVVVCVLTMPVQAAPSEDWGSWLTRKREHVVKMLKRFGGSIGSLGDMLGDPRPRP